MLTAPTRPDPNSKEISPCIRKSIPALLWSLSLLHPLQQANQLLLQDAEGGRVKVTKVVCLARYIHRGTE